MIIIIDFHRKNVRFLSKLKNQAGETLTETMVALLIASLGLVILAGAISATTRMVQRSEGVLESYYAQNNNVAEQTSASGELTITIKPEGDGSLSGETYKVNQYVNSYFSNTPIVSYHASETETTPP